ncbi:hypothetical protein D3C80_708620 [compost metagenome]
MALQQPEQVRRIGLGIALDAFDEMPQQQALLTADRVHADHRVLSLVHGRGEDLAIALQLLGRDVRPGAGVVVFVAVHGDQLVGQLTQLHRQPVIGSGGVGPQGVAAESRGHHRAQDRGFGVGLDEGHVGVPGARTLALGTVQLQQKTRTFAHRHSRVRHRFAEQVGERLLALVVELGLVAEEDHFVLQQCLLNGFNSGGIQLARKLYATDFGTDATGHRMDFKRVNSGLYCESGIAHG